MGHGLWPRAVSSAVLAGFALAGPLAVSAQEPPPCTSAEGFGTLDFWIGEWTVHVGDQQVGTNRIEKILDGCAVAEHWVDATGGRGESLFYFLPAEGVWKQVWVTENATVPGGVKEKILVEHLDDGAVRFQGLIARAGAPPYLDRTTLTPTDSGAVRQHIEISTDAGATWQTTFDAVYRRTGS